MPELTPSDKYDLTNPHVRNAISRHRSKEEIEQLKEKIQICILNGIGPIATAKQLGIPITTLYRYHASIAEDTVKHRLRKADQLLHNFYTRFEQDISDIEDAYRKAESPREKAQIKAIKTKAECDFFDRLQSAGFIRKVKDHVEVSGSIELQQWVQKYWRKIEVTSVDEVEVK
jgi:hypothetical protein